MIRPAALVLADGSVFEGELLGAEPAAGIASGEVVFNTVLSNHQEVITDPSSAGQIITFSHPHVGNYGISGIGGIDTRRLTRLLRDTGCVRHRIGVWPSGR